MESDATFRIIVSPTPMIGPDDLRKKDNHCDIGGFRHERDSFFQWAADNGFLEKGLYFMCGDRHWQYQAIDPTGFEEFSCGALVAANSRFGVKSGDQSGTDPEAKIKQPYSSREPSGGFLNVVIEPDQNQKTATLDFRFFDEKGLLLHSVKKTRTISDR
jgi:alkaline phosphatase/alkaline phosphatase D